MSTAKKCELVFYGSEEVPTIALGYGAYIVQPDGGEFSIGDRLRFPEVSDDEFLVLDIIDLSFRDIHFKTAYLGGRYIVRFDKSLGRIKHLCAYKFKTVYRAFQKGAVEAWGGKLSKVGKCLLVFFGSENAPKIASEFGAYIVQPDGCEFETGNRIRFPEVSNEQFRILGIVFLSNPKKRANSARYGSKYIVKFDKTLGPITHLCAIQFEKV